MEMPSFFRNLPRLWEDFDKCGKGRVRSSAFNSHENVTAALARIAATLK